MDVTRTLIMVIWLLVAYAIGGHAAPGDPLNMPSMNVYDHKTVIIHDNKGKTGIGGYDQKSGGWWLSEPSGKYTTGNQDGWGNEVVMEFGGEDGD